MQANRFEVAAAALRRGRLDGATLRHLMRRNGVTIREAARRLDVPMSLVRQRRRDGLPTAAHVVDWVQMLHA